MPQCFGCIDGTYQYLTYQRTLKIPNDLIRNPAYPLTPYCMKVYDYCSNNKQVVFNDTLSRLKARWRILFKKMD